MKKVLSTLLIVFLFVVSFFAVGFVALQPAKAETTGDSTSPPIQGEKSVITNHYADNINFSKSLYAVLSRIYTESGNTLGQGGSFPTDAFNDLTTLDLTIGQGALENYPAANKITSLIGMEHLSLNNLRTLKIDGHNITEIYSDDLSALNKLETLYITNSNVTAITFPVTMNNLNYLDLSNNKLTEVDISFLANKGTDLDGRPYCNLSNNKIEKVSSITLPTNYSLRALDVSFNNLVGVKATDFNASTVSILLQGYSPTEGLTYGQKIYMQDGFIRHETGGVVQNDNISNLKAKIFFNEDSAYATIKPEAIAETTDGYVTVPCGKLLLKFYQDDVEITGISVFEPRKVSVNPPTPIVKGYTGDQELLSLTSRDNITLKAELNLTGTSIDEFIKTNAVVKMKVGTNGDYVAGASLDFTKGGDYSVSTVITFDGLTSQATTSTVSRRDYTGLTWALIIVAILIAVIASGIFLTRWVKEGAVVAPLTDKETKRIYQKQGLDYYISDHRDLLAEENNETQVTQEETPKANDDNDDEVIGL